jgi:hypothetical protein
LDVDHGAARSDEDQGGGMRPVSKIERTIPDRASVAQDAPLRLDVAARGCPA